MFISVFKYILINIRLNFKHYNTAGLGTLYGKLHILKCGTEELRENHGRWEEGSMRPMNLASKIIVMCTKDSNNYLLYMNDTKCMSRLDTFNKMQILP